MAAVIIHLVVFRAARQAANAVDGNNIWYLEGGELNAPSFLLIKRKERVSIMKSIY